MATRGFGQIEPIARNAKLDGSDDLAGRQTNWRVEVTMGTNEKLKGHGLSIRRFCHALAWVAAMVALLGATTSGPSVSVTDGALTPKSMNVMVGASVLWTNAGTRQHEIVAQGEKFPTFTLTPGGTHSITFEQPGLYPYVLDSTVKGLVYVRKSSGGGVEGRDDDGQPSASSSSGCVTIYRYDVRVAAHREQTLTDSTLEGAAKTLSDWKASWVAPVYVDRCAGVKMLITARSAETSGSRGWPIYLRDGQFSRTFDYDDTETPRYDSKGKVMPPCHFTYASNGPAVMSVTALFTGAGKSNFDFLAGQDLRNQAASKAEFERQVDASAACPTYLTIANTSIISFNYTTIPKDDLPEIPGIRDSIIHDGQFHLIFDMPPNSPVEASILDALVAGKGFNYDTGMLLIQESHGRYSRSSRVRATVSFSRLSDNTP